MSIHHFVYLMGKPSGGGQADYTPPPSFSWVRSRRLRLCPRCLVSGVSTPEAGKPRLSLNRCLYILYIHFALICQPQNSANFFSNVKRGTLCCEF